MAKTVHAVAYLAAPAKHAPKAVNVVYGNDAFLKRLVLSALKKNALGSDDAGFSRSVFEGEKAVLKDVLDELSTVAMFGGGRRLVVIEDADNFVSLNRAKLEAYAEDPLPTGRLILEVKSWPTSTRLHRIIAETGLPVECSTPSGAQLSNWLVAWARQSHRAELEPGAARMMVEIVGPELGLLDQEIAKLALAVPEGAAISAKLVAERVGSWRARTAWEMIDAALAGNLREALVQLDRLLRAGEAPLGILAQISATLRRLAAATRLVLSAEAQRQRVTLRSALAEAQVRTFVLDKSERQLKHLGRDRGRQLYRWLLEADLALKGDSALPGRLILENLLIRLAARQTK
ncbi:MAG: DNA polymerase III subunit delta [Pirellulaceae bacterium]|jgi:DNA polymerase-3 subunit delta|nr:DNA polymerase III subunit delta [Planctomycetota bacterium]NLZ00290.1 DNA polymerase III subunit delta [Pirellulaceae bacterium]